LYAGFWPATFGHLPGNTVYLVTYTYLKDVLQKKENARNPNKTPDGKQAPWVSFVAAMGADAAAVAFYCPVDVVVQRLFLQSSTNPTYSGYQDVIATILKQEGWKGLYRGVGPILLNSLPASAIWWTIYEECKTYFSQWIDQMSNKDEGAKKMTFGASDSMKLNLEKSTIGNNESVKGENVHVVHKHAAANMAAGGLAGAIVTFLTNPLDVVRTRLQTQSMKAESYQYSSAWHTVQEMWRGEGYRAFFKGTTPRLTQWVIFSSASAFAYEFVVDVSTIKRT
jgi:solute carrier family 25 folate transporter 32